VPTDTPPGNNAPHAERAAELLHAFGFEAEKHPVPGRRGQGLRPGVHHQPGRAAPLWRRPGHRAERARRRGAAWRRLDARPVRRRDRRRLPVWPRGRGEQVRLRHLQLRGARAGITWAPLRGGVELHFTYDEEFGGEMGPGWLLEGHHQARPDAGCRLQLPGGGGAQRLPAAGSDRARRDEPCRHPGHRHRRPAGRHPHPDALYALNRDYLQVRPRSRASRIPT
jgi:hypothetical protein